MSDKQSLTRQQIRRKRKFGEPVLPEDEAETEQEHRHMISVRLENTILVTKRGHKDLTRMARVLQA